ncbi:MAG: hypothetical protein RIM68_01715 [Arenibacter sp.]
MFHIVPNPEVTIYIISSSIDPMDVIKVQDYGLVSNYILKPIKSADLLKLLSDGSNRENYLMPGLKLSGAF